MNQIDLDTRTGYPQLMKYSVESQTEAIAEIVADNLNVGDITSHRGVVKMQYFEHVGEISEILEERPAKGEHTPPQDVFQSENNRRCNSTR